MNPAQQAQAAAEWYADVDDAVNVKLPQLQQTVAQIIANGVGGGGGGGGGPSESISVKSFPGVVGDGSHDDTAGLFLARDFIANCANPPKLVFPAGMYRYTQSPNWAIQNALYDAEGDVRLRHTGHGAAVILDGGAGEIYNCVFGSAGRFIVEAERGVGIHVRSFHHSKVKARIRGCGNDSSAFVSNFAVCSEFDLHVTSNGGGWFDSGKPLVGVELNCRGEAEPTAYCYFPNPIIEACVTGIKLVSTLGNNFIGGTSEGHSGLGVDAGVNARFDKFRDVDFEVNVGGDVLCNGYGLRFIECESEKMITLGSGSRWCRVVGGFHRDIHIGAGSFCNILTDAIYNRMGPNGTYTGGNISKDGSAIGLGIRDCRNAQTGAVW